MLVDPKPLQKGWIKRCFINSLKLSLRSPLAWIVIYLGFPVLLLYIPYIQLGVLCAGIMLIAGTFLCFSQDHLREFNFSDFFAILIVRPQILVYLIVITGISFSPVSKIALNEEFSFSFAMDMMTISTGIFHFMLIFAPILILLVVDLPIGIYKILSNRSEEPENGFSPFSYFALHLSVETNLSWSDCAEYSKKGFRIIQNSYMDMIFLLTLFTLSLVFPILIGLLVPFYYCVYRELFWQSGVSERKARVTVENIS